MGRKYKVTGCAKFALVIVILAPIAYLGAAWYNGEDGIENIKALLGLDDNEKRIVAEPPSQPSDTKELDIQEPEEHDNSQIHALKDSIEQLHKNLQEKDKEIENLRKQEPDSSRQ